jgi:enhancer of mRNA-decapping protein 3
MINADNVYDLSEVKDEAEPGRSPTQPLLPVDTNIPAEPSFHDPAILSLGKRPDSTSTLTQIAHPRPSEKGGLQVGQPSVLPPLQIGAGSRDSTPHIDPADSRKARKVATPPHADDDEPVAEVSVQDGQSQAHRKKNRSNKTARGKQDEFLDSPPTRQVQGGRGKGWRQTPILQSTSSFQPFNSLKKNGGQGRKGGADNGWASEEVTEEMGEFDFEAGLAKFDKRTVFDQMRREDQVDEADRLVSHNRRAKPGTAGGKNLHYTENVLDLPPTGPKNNNDFWNSEADDAIKGVERLSGRELGSRQSNRRAESKPAGNRRSQSRKASAVATTAPGQPLPRVNSGVCTCMSRDYSVSANGRMQQHGASPAFYIHPSNRRLETVSALQMLNLENIAANEIGLTGDMMTENAGRGIAEVALMALSDPAIQIQLGAVGTNTLASNVASSSTIVILAGNNKSGIRAVAACRNLRNKGVNVLLCVVGIERERDLLEDLKQQTRIYKNMGGRIYNKLELFEQLRQTSGKATNQTTVTLIIDALLGLAISFEELRTSDQATVYELIEWANRNPAFVLAVDVPTGIDPSTGNISIIDGNQLYVKPRYVVAMGAPKRGLLEAMAPAAEVDGDSADGGGAADEVDWKLYIVDMGLGTAVWKKAGTKIRRGIDFGDKWVLEMRYLGTIATGE